MRADCASNGVRRPRAFQVALLLSSLWAFAALGPACHKAHQSTPGTVDGTSEVGQAQSAAGDKPKPNGQYTALGASAAGWSPIRVPEDCRLELWRLPQQRIVVLPARRDPWKYPWVFPVGRAAGRSAVQLVRDAQGAERQALVLYQFGASEGVSGPLSRAFIEFPLRLPASSPVQLRATLAFSPPRPQQKRLGGMAIWRVWVRPFDAPPGVYGPVVFAWQASESEWTDVVVDLSDFAGQTIRLQLTTLPPSHAPFTHWVEPTLVAGSPN